MNSRRCSNERIERSYERTDLEIIKFQTSDVIATSGIDYEDDETSRIK
ncbi:MAG: hypothetical protein IIZ07_00825 [Ruminococcus sp.]|nr:hypothetical protein [Ruminococcus sp.]